LPLETLAVSLFTASYLSREKKEISRFKFIQKSPTKLSKFMFENEKFDEILAILKRGGVILFPTDTIWGIGCDATNEDAVQRIIDIKTRPPEKGFVSLADSLDMVKRHTAAVHPRIQTLLGYHIRPLTVIYDKGIGVSSKVLAPDGSIALRITRDAFCRELIAQFGKPLVATSANVSGSPFPTHFGDIRSDILEQVDMVVRLKQDNKERGEPSVIVRLNEDEELEFLRE
jgi:L-threonylcarbamoyladenylate synthase